MCINIIAGRCHCFILLLVLVAAESSAVTDHSSTNSSFRFSLQSSLQTVVAKCVATLVAPRWVITAAHCFDGAVSELFAHCPEDSSAEGSRHAVKSTVLHTEIDLALLELPELPGCVNTPVGLLQTIPESAVFTSVALAATERESISFETLQQDELTLLLLDSTACLARGDSGYPLYVESEGKNLLGGVLIGGTEECPNYQQAVRLDKQVAWIKKVISGKASAGQNSQPACAMGLCLKVDRPGAVFCSVDPPGINRLASLAFKSRITFETGIYDFSNTGTNPLPAIELQSALSKQQYLVDQLVSVKTVNPIQSNRISQHSLEVTAHYSSAAGKKIRLNFRVRPAENSSANRFDDSDAKSFFSNGLNLRIRYSDNTSMLYAPCALPGEIDREFVFKLLDGTEVFARAKAVTGSYGLGYAFGHLLGARIVKADTTLEVNNQLSLGYLGSSLSQGDLNAPTLVIRTDPVGNTCGYVFDSSGWETAEAVNGYLAYSLHCDYTLGERLPLVSASYPADYVFP